MTVARHVGVQLKNDSFDLSNYQLENGIPRLLSFDPMITFCLDSQSRMLCKIEKQPKIPLKSRLTIRHLNIIKDNSGTSFSTDEERISKAKEQKVY